jgi:hypothetical protein
MTFRELIAIWRRTSVEDAAGAAILIVVALGYASAPEILDFTIASFGG